MCDVKFVIIGEGKLEDNVCALLNKYALENEVELTRLILHSGLLDYLYSLKLLPSYAERLPNIRLKQWRTGRRFLPQRSAPYRTR